MCEVILQSVLTCPECGNAKNETMRTDACQWFDECESRNVVLRPNPGDCCVFCSYGTVKCPAVQSDPRFTDRSTLDGAVPRLPIATKIVAACVAATGSMSVAASRATGIRSSRWPSAWMPRAACRTAWVAFWFAWFAFHPKTELLPGH